MTFPLFLHQYQRENHTLSLFFSCENNSKESCILYSHWNEELSIITVNNQRSFPPACLHSLPVQEEVLPFNPWHEHNRKMSSISIGIKPWSLRAQTWHNGANCGTQCWDRMLLGDFLPRWNELPDKAGQRLLVPASIGAVATLISSVNVSLRCRAGWHGSLREKGSRCWRGKEFAGRYLIWEWKDGRNSLDWP